MAKDFKKLLDDLYTGKIKELDVSQEDFMEFQPIYMAFQYRNFIVGKAKRGGGAVYHSTKKKD